MIPTLGKLKAADFAGLAGLVQTFSGTAAVTAMVALHMVGKGAAQRGEGRHDVVNGGGTTS